MANIVRKTYREQDGLLVSEGIKRLVDPDTGEDVFIQHVDKQYYGQRHFWKMYLFDFLSMLGIIENKQLDVICYIMENTEPANNMFIGSMREIAKKIGCSTWTVNETIQKLKGISFITQGPVQGTYLVNPNVMVKGSEAKKRGLMITYQENKSAATFRAAKKMNALDPGDNQLAIELNLDESSTAKLEENNG